MQSCPFSRKLLFLWIICKNNVFYKYFWIILCIVVDSRNWIKAIHEFFIRRFNNTWTTFPFDKLPTFSTTKLQTHLRSYGSYGSYDNWMSHFRNNIIMIAINNHMFFYAIEVKLKKFMGLLIFRLNSVGLSDILW